MSNDARYYILNDGFDSPIYRRMSFGKLAWFTVILPLTALVFNVFYSVLFNFEQATFTHCNVFNFLPSISAAIGNYSPQKEVWQTAIILQAAPRFYACVMYLQYHREVLSPKVFVFAIIACLLNFVENIALIILSFWTSSQYYRKCKDCCFFL